WRVPGLAIAVVKDGRVVFAKGYGVRELGKPAPVDTNTLFAIGSTTKAMTAAAMGMLVDEKKVRWDEPVTTYLPAFAVADPYLTREITVRDLLTHRAGLGNADYLWYESDLTTPDIVRRLRYVRPAYSMRSSFVYQNVMYAVAGQVIEAASGGTPWASFLRARLLQPLGMTGTSTTLGAIPAGANVASPHFVVHDSVVVIRNASVDAVAPAGAVWSSVADMAKWMRFVLDSGRVGDRRLLAPGTWAELLKPQTMVTPKGFYPTASLTHPHWTTYGLGWFQEDYAGRALDFHTGSIDGMVAIVGLVPDERFGVYVLANLDHAELRHALMYKAIDLWLGTGSRDWSAEMKTMYAALHARADSAERAAAGKRIKGTRPSLALDRYAGSYVDSLYGSVRVDYAGGKLTLRTSSKSVAALEHWQYDTFLARWSSRWRGTTPVTFTIGDDGRPSRLEMDGAAFTREAEMRPAATAGGGAGGGGSR
ncbi:MAG TPA: serine hydrolase, partial [Gemmatimonadaceae bacterium]|nr:serine hydrolase [Gemmatimonadaceae bacterium]